MSSDDEDSKVNVAAHKKLLSEINDIVKFQHIKKPKRSEPAIKNDEFHLVKTKPVSQENVKKKVDKKRVTIKSLASVVRKNENQKKISNELQNTFRSVKLLQKPLEKVHADRISRNIAYDNTKTKLSRWDAVVAKNKHADQLKFPLNYDKAFMDKNRSDSKKSGYTQLRYKTKMVQEMEEIYNECFPMGQEPLTNKKSTELLTLEEMRERRKELNKLKMRESYQISKKRMQGKIKSKKYHRLKKREDLKKKLKEFEELKAVNPEAALKELEKIEKQRIQERVNLRHKNTGTWAKNMKIRAQYDTTAKAEIEAQLALSRELTQKQKKDSSDSDSDDEAMSSVLNKNKDNPWLSGKVDDDDEIFSGYRKFWEEKNANEKAIKEYKAGESGKLDVKSNSETVKSDKLEGESKNISQKSKKKIESKSKAPSVGSKLKSTQKSASNMEDSDEETADEQGSVNCSDEKMDIETETDKTNVNGSKNEGSANFKELSSENSGSESEFDQNSTDSEDPNMFINDLFDKAEENVNNKLTSKLTELKPKLLIKDPPKTTPNPSKAPKDVHDPSYLEFSRKSRMQDIDEALLEGGREEQEVLTPSKKLLQEIQSIKDEKKAFMRGTKDEIDPDSFLKIKSKHLLTAVPQTQLLDDGDEDEIDDLAAANRMSLAEAFENDDIVQDFVDESEENAKKIVEMNGLPGWGSWGGEGVKNKEQLSKKPQVKKKDRVIIDTTPHEGLRKHLISKVPFPFTTIQDFEASLRIPIGKDFIPSMAHKKLTMESIVTKAGTIIEPMTEEALVKAQKRKLFKRRRFDNKKIGAQKMKIVKQ